MLPSIEHDQVVRHEFPHFDFLVLAITDHGGRRLKQAFQGRVGTLGLIFLDKAENGINDDHGHDDAEVAIFPYGERHPCGDQDDVHQRAFEL